MISLYSVYNPCYWWWSTTSGSTSLQWLWGGMWRPNCGCCKQWWRCYICNWWWETTDRRWWLQLQWKNGTLPTRGRLQKREKLCVLLQSHQTRHHGIWILHWTDCWHLQKKIPWAQFKFQQQKFETNNPLKTLLEPERQQHTIWKKMEYPCSC